MFIKTYKRNNMAFYPHVVTYTNDGSRITLTEDEFREKMNQFFDDSSASLRDEISPQSRDLMINHYWYSVILPQGGKEVPYVGLKPVPEIMRLYHTNNFVAAIMANESQNHLKRVAGRQSTVRKLGLNIDFDGNL
jgi:hypothetical protein